MSAEKQNLWGALEKEAEASGTAVMPNSRDAARGPQKGDLNFMPKSAVASRVNVEALEPASAATVKTATRFALPSQQKYPIDSYADVEKAASYFAEHRNQFVPAQRREYCVSLTKRAAELGVKVSDDIGKYGSATYGSQAEMELGISSRMSVVSGSAARLLSKVAAERDRLTPDYYAAALQEFDKIAGIEHHYDHYVLDPWYSTFGTKVADDELNGSFVTANETIYYKDIKKLSMTPCVGMEQVFGDGFVESFKKDPVGIFKSLPLDLKKLIGRMAAEAGMK